MKTIKSCLLVRTRRFPLWGENAVLVYYAVQMTFLNWMLITRNHLFSPIFGITEHQRNDGRDKGLRNEIRWLPNVLLSFYTLCRITMELQRPYSLTIHWGWLVGWFARPVISVLEDATCMDQRKAPSTLVDYNSLQQRCLFASERYPTNFHFFFKITQGLVKVFSFVRKHF